MVTVNAWAVSMLWHCIGTRIDAYATITYMEMKCWHIPWVKNKWLIIFHVITCMISFVYSHRACSNAHCYPSLGLCYSRLPGPSLQLNIVIKMAQPLLGKSCYITGCKWYLHFSTFKIWTHSPTSTHILMLFAMHIALPIFQLRFHNWEFVFRLQST